MRASVWNKSPDPGTGGRSGVVTAACDPPGGAGAVPAAQGIDLVKTFGTGPAEVHALAGVTVTFEKGRFTAVMGPSGSGKSTLMHCMAGLDRPTSGQVFVGGQDIGKL